MTARDWLRENGYEDVAELIDRVMAEIEANGSKQRRNWWDALAGGGGRPITVSGHEFPVLRVAQIRQGRDVTDNALSRNPDERPPDVVSTKRWPRKRLPSKVARNRAAGVRRADKAKAS